MCGNKLLVTNNEEAIVEKTFKLSCDHMYPYLKAIFVSSWFFALAHNIHTKIYSQGFSLNFFNYLSQNYALEVNHIFLHLITFIQ